MNGPEDNRKFEVIQGAGDRLENDSTPELEFEQQLARALRRVDAPEGFAARLMDRAAKGDTAPVVNVPVVEVPAVEVPGRSPGPSPKSGFGRMFVIPRRQWLGWASGAIAATLVAGIFTGQHLHEQHERRAAAEREFDTSMRIRNEALEHVRQQLAEQGITLGNE
ncbi:hypothetical protein SAMN05421819_2248 [Bryocella elongata]|uniref:Uncharacterized protein n=1 Tax=Bryocella elongata TaxID=863522 RepID=A0A1H5YDT9_9BACT|nr:hypothetical protein [Bryocella elongata]SEG21932.1 hypothetical protein SAMN05421819_2248 [Bryocella elongata]